MGCMKSKQTFPFPTTFAPEKQDESEETFMPEQEFLSRKSSPVHVQEEVKKSPVPSTVVLKYAQRLSQEILDDALQQWARNNIKYYDIPYIESDSEGLDAVG